MGETWDITVYSIILSQILETEDGVGKEEGIFSSDCLIV